MRFEAIVPVILKNIDPESNPPGSRLLGKLPISAGGYEESGLAVDPRVWKLLQSMDSKLDLILERLCSQIEDQESAAPRPVRLDDEILEIDWDSAVDFGRTVEIRMWLTTRRTIGILLYGLVEECAVKSGHSFKIRCHMTDVSEEVRDVLVEYAIDRQREEINKRRLAAD